jgi:CheY-like chemotaxis protein
MEEINLLYVDKSTIAQRLMTKGLEQIANITGASSLAEARQAIGSQAFNFFILDYELPDGDGLAFASELRDHRDHAHTPIILYTASLNNELEYRAMQAGVNEGLSKPIDMLDMMQHVARQAEVPSIKKVRRELLQLSCFSWNTDGTYFEYSPDLGLLISGDDKQATRDQMRAALEEQILAKDNPSRYPADIEVYKHVIGLPPAETDAA